MLLNWRSQTTGCTKELEPLVSGRGEGYDKMSVGKGVMINICLLFTAFSAVMLLATLLGSPGIFSRNSAFSTSNESGLFDTYGRYIMKDFDKLKPVSNFLPGLAGIWGIPMWAFFVNRGQAISSFGIQSKDNAIAKFFTAEKAYQLTPWTGFRSFVMGKKVSSSSYWSHMPFFPYLDCSGAEDPEGPVRTMMVGSNELEIEESLESKSLKTNILYFIGPNEPFPFLVRQSKYTNLDSEADLVLHVFDGLGRVLPSGLSNSDIDQMGRLREAWMRVYNTNDTGYKVPFFHISQGTEDTASVTEIHDGHFAVSFIQPPDGVPVAELLPFIVDPNVMFGEDTTLSMPKLFFNLSSTELEAGGVTALLEQTQTALSRTPCAFSGAHVTVPAGKTVTITSVYGHAKTLEQLNMIILPKIKEPGFIYRKRREARELVEGILEKVETSTSSDVFDGYVGQSFLDNSLRGGLPIEIVPLPSSTQSVSNPDDNKDDKTNKSSHGPAEVTAGGTIYYVFSRIHGDLERDYNFFQVDATYLSQGPGNFRDVNQNRRVDLFHTPAVGDFNVRLFLSLIQSDGYNPLTVAGTNFRVLPTEIDTLLSKLNLQSASEPASRANEFARVLLSKPFRLGQFFTELEAAGVTLGASRDEALRAISSAARQEFAAQFKQNGYWSDHWTYTLDLVENYLSVFPDRAEQLLWDAEPSPFYMSPAVVKSRRDRYSQIIPPDASPSSPVMPPGKEQGSQERGVRVYNAISSYGDKDFPPQRARALETIWSDPNYIADTSGAGGAWQRTATGAVYAVSPMAKLIMLGVIKFSTLDPSGMGVEMEGGKPGWNDAMNGLPGLIGSGMPETYEMLRVLNFAEEAIKRYDRDVTFPIEFTDFLSSIVRTLDQYAAAGGNSTYEEGIREGRSVGAADFAYWDACNNAREKYRDRTMATFSGKESILSSRYLLVTLSAMREKVKQGITRAMLLTSVPGVSPTYFYHDCLEYDIVPVSNNTLNASVSNGSAPKASVGAKKPYIIPRTFVLRTLPLFLEGPTRHLKILRAFSEQKKVYRAIKESPLYDEPLKMFTISESLKNMRQDVGRMMAFSAGWLENQSVWLHMSYKFYLELLRARLYEEFFEELSTGLVANMDPKVYGRSPLEASSFIVSTAFPDDKLRGTGFLARLSGSTVEFLSMWTIMMAGHKPFVVDEDDRLTLNLRPILPAWLFKDDDTISFTFLGCIAVTYHNPERRDTWTITPKTATVTLIDKPGFEGSFKERDGMQPAKVIFKHSGVIDDAQIADAARRGLVSRIDIFY